MTEILVSFIWFTNIRIICFLFSFDIACMTISIRYRCSYFKILEIKVRDSNVISKHVHVKFT